MKLILASGSPRRKELLGQAGYEFEVRVSDADENVKETSPAKLVELLSYRKAMAVARDCLEGEDCLVIGSDTVVALEEQILGKPVDEDDAFAMLKKLSGHVHQVYTGVALILVDGEGNVKAEKIFHEATDVCMREIEEEEIRNYIATKEPLDKAGAYGIQGKAAVFISGIHGDYYNVVGLPVCRLVTELKAFATAEN